jgi:hypothetical protein
MPRRTEFSSDQKKRVWAATRKVELLPSDIATDSINAVPNAIYFRNDSAQTVPPYGLMQISGTVEVTGSFNYVTIKRPIDATLMRCPLLINGPREVLTNEYGSAQIGPVYRLLHNGTAYVAGDRLGSLTATFTATYGSLYAVLGEDDIATDIVRVMFDTSCMYGKTQGAALVAGAPANVLAYDATDTITAKEYLAETLGASIPADTRILMLSSYGRWFASEIC